MSQVFDSFNICFLSKPSVIMPIENMEHNYGPRLFDLLSAVLLSPHAPIKRQTHWNMKCNLYLKENCATEVSLGWHTGTHFYITSMPSNYVNANCWVNRCRLVWMGNARAALQTSECSFQISLHFFAALKCVYLNRTISSG